MIRNNLSWINLNTGSSGGGGGGVSDYNDLANRPIISMTGTSQNPLKLWNLSTGLYLLNGYVYYDTTNSRECINLFISITAQIQNGKYVLSAFVPSWKGHYEYIKANSTSTDYTDTQILKMLTEDDVLTLTNEVEYTPTTDYHPSTKKYVDEAMQSVMEEFAKMGVNEQDIKTLIAENRRRDIAIQALLNETADKNVTIEEDTHTISLDYSMEDGMATVNSIEGSTLVNVSKTVDEVYITKSQDRVEQTKVANTIGEQNGKLCPIIEGDTLVNVCDQKEPIAITKSYTVENSGNHIALQGEYDGKCRPVIQGNTMVNLVRPTIRTATFANSNRNYNLGLATMIKPNTTYTIRYTILELTLGDLTEIPLYIQISSVGVDGLHVDTVADIGVYTYKFTTKDATDIQNASIVLKGTTSQWVEGCTQRLTISDVMLFEGDLTQTPELIPTEYVEGLKSSFEDNVVTQAMVDSGEESAENLGKYKVEYKVTGKNKFDTNCKRVRLGTSGNPSEGTQTEVTSTSTSSKHQYGVLKLPKGTYNWTMPEGDYFPSNWSMSLFESNKEDISIGDTLDVIAKVYFTGISFTKTFTCRKKYQFVQLAYLDEEVPNDILNTIQIEEGTIATEYEPYKEYTKTFYLNSPLLEGDTIEDISGVATHVKRYGKVVLDGSETWHQNSVLTNTTRYQWSGISNALTSGRGFCDNLVYIKGNSEDIEHIRLDGTSPTAYINVWLSNDKDISQWLSENPTTVVYELASPIYEKISNESILCDSYVNGHLDFDSAVPIEKVVFGQYISKVIYIQPNTRYKVQFESDNVGVLDALNVGGMTIYPNLNINKGLNELTLVTPNSPTILLVMVGIGFNASNIVVTEATDKDFDYFNGIQSTFEENLVTDENNPHYGKYRVIYRTKSSDGNASTVKSVYLNSPLLQGDKLVVVNGKLCHYHKMGMVVLNGSDDELWFLAKNDNNQILTSKFVLNNLRELPISTKNIFSNKFRTANSNSEFNRDDTEFIYGISIINLRIMNSRLSTLDVNGLKQWLQANPTTVVYELAEPYYEEISSNPKDTVVDFYANGTLEVQSVVYPLSMEFTSFEEELTYLYASTVYTVQFEANGNAIANITLGGTTVANQEITHGLNKIQVTTPSTLVDNKLIIDGCGDCKISKVVVTNSTEEFDYFEGMKSAFEDKQNEDGTYTVEIVVYNAPIRLNKDKE